MSTIELPAPVRKQLDQVTGAANNEIVRYCDEKFNKAKQGRQTFERQWYSNMAFYFGRHYVQWIASGTSADFQRMVEPPAPPWRVRMIVNKTRAIIRAEIAKVTKEKPRGFVIPSTTDDEDVAAARAGDAIFDHEWRELVMNKQLRRTMFWTLLCGTAFMKDWYDEITPDASKVPGSIMIEPTSPFHLLVPDLQEEEIENQPYTIHCLAKDPSWVYKTFGVELSPDSGAGAGVLEQKFLSALGINNARNDRSLVAVKEAWFKPCSKFPDGAVVLWAGDQVLHVKEDGFSYNHGEYPFTKFDHIPTGRFYSDSTLVDLIPLQKEYNRTRSQIIEAKNKMSKPQLVAARGSVDPNKITSEPGLIIFYTPGFQPPTPIPLSPLPQYVIEEQDRIQRDMDDISSQHEITKGRTPPGVTAATAISYLQEEDDSKLSSTISSLEEGVEKIGRHILSHVAQFWDAERQVRIVGENGQWETYTFQKAAINGNTDFRVEAGSATPRSRAAKQAFIMEMMEKGYIPPEKGLRYLDMAETSRLYEDMQINIRHAMRENMLMLAGQEVPVHSYDDHLAHIDSHDDYRKKQEYENSEDEIKQVYEKHVNNHKMILCAMFGQLFAPGDPRIDGFIMQLRMGQVPPPMGGEAQNALGASGSNEVQPQNSGQQ